MINHGEESPSMDGFEQSKKMAWQRVGCGCRSGKPWGKPVGKMMDSHGGSYISV